MPEYAQHSACCLMWKKAIYVVGGEIEGHWSPKAFKFELETFNFRSIANIDPVVKMASLTPLVSENISGVFLAGLQTIDGCQSII